MQYPGQNDSCARLLAKFYMCQVLQETTMKSRPPHPAVLAKLFREHVTSPDYQGDQCKDDDGFDRLLMNLKEMENSTSEMLVLK